MPPDQILTPEQIAERAKIHAAFTEVFGINGAQRTTAQLLVIETFKKTCYADKPVFVPDAAGRLCPIRASFTDGKRAVWIALNEEISFR